MSEHCGFVVEVKDLRKHGNADRLMVATFFGNDTIVSLDTKVGDVGVYFPIDIQLSEEYCTQNDLVRRKDEYGNTCGGYLDPEKRNIKALKLRGEKSDGLFMPLKSFDYIYSDGAANHLTIGDKVEMLEGHEICRKYIPKRRTSTAPVGAGNRTRKKKVPIAPLFMEHADTEQLNYNLAAFHAGDLVEITLKMHGTSARTGYLPKFKGYKRTIWDIITRKPGTPIYDWGYVTGTRRTVLNDFAEGGYYGDNAFREGPAKFFEGKLNKGETVYYEIVGYTCTGQPIMASQSNKQVDKLLGDKSFSKQYGATTEFSYGCDPKGERVISYWDKEHTFPAAVEQVPQQDFYVYRMTMTNEDGDVVEYSPDFMRYRCEQMGAKSVIPFWRGFIPELTERIIGKDADNNWVTAELCSPGEWIKDVAEQYYDGPDPVGKTHVREGVVVRIVNRPKFTAYKTKNFAFKVLSGIAVDNIDPNTMDDDLLSEQ